MRLLVEALGSPANMNKIHFYSNMSGDGGAAAASVLMERLGPNLLDFCMSSCRVREAGGLSLARGLQFSQQLRVLDLSDSMFGEKGGAALAETLTKLPSLNQLILKDSGVSGKGLDSILNALIHQALEVLDLASLDMGPEGAAKLAKQIANLPALRELRLAENGLQNKGAKALAAAAYVFPFFSRRNFCSF